MALFCNEYSYKANDIGIGKLAQNCSNNIRSLSEDVKQSFEKKIKAILQNKTDYNIEETFYSLCNLLNTIETEIKKNSRSSMMSTSAKVALPAMTIFGLRHLYKKWKSAKSTEKKAEKDLKKAEEAAESSESEAQRKKAEEEVERQTKKVEEAVAEVIVAEAMLNEAQEASVKDQQVNKRSLKHSLVDYFSRRNPTEGGNRKKKVSKKRRRTKSRK